MRGAKGAGGKGNEWEQGVAAGRDGGDTRRGEVTAVSQGGATAISQGGDDSSADWQWRCGGSTIKDGGSIAWLALVGHKEGLWVAILSGGGVARGCRWQSVAVRG